MCLLGLPATRPPASPGSQSGLPVGKGPIDGSRSEAELGPIRQVDGLSAVRGGAHIRSTCCTVRLIRRRLGPSLDMPSGQLRYPNGRRSFSDRQAGSGTPEIPFVTKICELVSPGWAVDLYTLCSAVTRAVSSVGRALPLQGRCRGFESLNAHAIFLSEPRQAQPAGFCVSGTGLDRIHF